MNFKKFIIGLAIFVLTLAFIIYINEVINPKPKNDYNVSRCNYGKCVSDYDGGSYNTYQEAMKNYKVMSFVTILILSILVMIAGILIRSVAAVSYGLLFAGLVAIIYVLILSFEEIPSPLRAIISGLGLGVMIWIAYVRFPPKLEESLPSSPDPGLVTGK
jgi:NADH:ubiquinone oxidoreductase subunit 3 (subunit A)